MVKHITIKRAAEEFGRQLSEKYKRKDLIYLYTALGCYPSKRGYPRQGTHTHTCVHIHTLL